ncbi:MAG: hypothetical protein WC222_06840 [Parachlamydiales bacterium]|jgi:hypothetical protein
MRTVTVYVKHYLTDQGRDFFKQVWYPKVLSSVQNQDGFISLSYEENIESPDCMDLTLKFKDENTLNAWIDVPDHDDLIKELDEYRSRGYWKAVYTTDDAADPAKLNWELITV